MQKVICIVPVAPMRAEVSHRSEMTSQLILGETAEVLEIDKQFTKIKTDLNNYEGWIQNPQITQVSEENNGNYFLGFASNNSIISFDKRPMFISIGTPVFNTNHLGKFEIDYSNIAYENNIPFSEINLKEIAYKLLNTSYLWGGRTAFGIDCSGYTQLVYQFFGISLPRDAYQQATIGDTIDFLEQTIYGDLAYFDNADRKIIHVGILLNSETIIHASGKVRIDKIDAQGIVNAATGARTHNLRIIKRVI